MRTHSFMARICVPVLVLLLGSGAGTALAQSSHVLFLDGYPQGDFYFAELPDLDARRVRAVRPLKLTLDLPSRLRRRFQVANGDIYSDGNERRIVFGGRTGNGADWDIYEGRIDLERGRIDSLRVLVSNRGVREEDPRYSADGTQVVYKCDGKICLFPYYDEPVVEAAGCELWAPSLDASGFVISYARRCGDPDSDRILRYSLLDGSTAQVPNTGGGPDRFAHFTRTGEIVYSHLDAATGTSSLWLSAQPGQTALLHDQTESDDDPYADRHGDNLIAFIGWLEPEGYSLYVHRRTERDAIRLTEGINVLGPVLFR